MPPVSMVVLVPVLDDWLALSVMLPRLSAVLSGLGVRAGLLVVDDGSTSRDDALLAARPWEALEWITVLRLRENVGHQRAIAIGFGYVVDHVRCEAVVVMDADGQDRPEDIAALVERSRQAPGTIVFAGRRRRGEGLAFRTGYVAYRLLHRLLTGRGVSVGNFSLVPAMRLDQLRRDPGLWTHYAATVVRSAQPWLAVPVERGRRLAGTSRMTLVSLVVHGLRAISLYGNVVRARLSAATMGLALMAMAALLARSSLRDGLVPVLLLLGATLSAALVFVGARANRRRPTPVPESYRQYIAAVVPVDAAAAV